MSWGHAQGARGSYLQVHKENAVARNLYERFGFGEAYCYH
ncbi:hypothetical protein EDF56_11445 [Novosphingobium sp. PhB165]|nr:hypothetical protein EDF56_11445 [Novosphingobium sp. PhB165]